MKKLGKIKCSLFSSLIYFKGLKTSTHISKIPQSVVLIKKGISKVEEEIESFFVHVSLLQVAVVWKRLVFSSKIQLSQQNSG